MVLFSSWQILHVFSSCIVSLRGNVELYYVIEQNIFLLFVGSLFYFGKFFNS